MTPPGLPDSRTLFAWHRRFPDRLHLWAGYLRLWTVELPVQVQSAVQPLTEWIAKAARQGLAAPADVAQKLGIPEAAVREAQRPVRRSYAFLELPSGPHLVPAVSRTTSTGPISITAADLPHTMLRPPGVEVIPLSDDWRTIPFVRAVLVRVLAVRGGDGIQLYVADRDWTIGLERTWQLPSDVILPEVQVSENIELLPGEQWLWSGSGPLWEASLRAQ